MTNKLHLKYAEFYITNSCNFNCTGCNRFNNYSFSGNQRWEDYANYYQRWSEILDLDKWTILGGEPMMNPTYLDWVKNISRLWPNAQGSFLTNGYFLNEKNKDLYNAIQATNGQVRIHIGLHNVDRREKVLALTQSWLQGDVVIKRIPEDLNDLPNFKENWQASYNKIRDPSWPDCNNVNDWDSLSESIKKECHEVFQFSPEIISEIRKGWIIVDSNGVTVLINMEDYFNQGALKNNDLQSFSLHDSDPIKAHDICNCKSCHHFIRGKLYKCGVVGLLPELDQQFNLELSDNDRKLMNAYQPGELTQDWDSLKTFIDNIEQPIGQCKFCPETYDIKQIFAGHGQKIKIIRKT
jgi:hypothetical protein